MLIVSQQFFKVWSCSDRKLFYFYSTIADTELNGYFIPKDTRILSNTWAIHHDPEYWGPDADKFRAERFLTDDGKEVKKWDRYMPFSIGKILFYSFIRYIFLSKESTLKSGFP